MTDDRPLPTTHDAHELAAELALGIAPGMERARALRHMETCARCRQEVASLGEVADGLLLLVPAREPPIGFESRVLDRLSGPARGGPRWRRLLRPAAAVVVAAAIAGGSVWWATGSDRQSAALFHRALDRAGGQYFGTEILHDLGGDRVGHVFVYGGETSWIFIVLEQPSVDRSYAVETRTETGELVPVGGLEVTGDTPGGGLILPIDLRDVTEVLLVPADGGQTLTAHLPAAPSAG